MRLISLILSVTVCCSYAVAQAQENYSLWPRRPAELEQARHLFAQQQDAQVVTLLLPFIHKHGLAGHEARSLVGQIRVRQYLSVNNPYIYCHTVRRGDNLDRIATAYHSSPELIMLINMLSRPSELKVGQTLYVVPANMRLELHVIDREITLWNGRTLVASYGVYVSPELTGPGQNEEATLTDRTGEINGTRVPRVSALFASSDRMLTFSNGLVLINKEQRPPRSAKAYVQMQRHDLNELSLLIRGGARLSVVRNEEKFDPYATPANNRSSSGQNKGAKQRRRKK